MAIANIITYLLIFLVHRWIIGLITPAILWLCQNRNCSQTQQRNLPFEIPNELLFNPSIQKYHQLDLNPFPRDQVTIYSRLLHGVEESCRLCVESLRPPGAFVIFGAHRHPNPFRDDIVGSKTESYNTIDTDDSNCCSDHQTFELNHIRKRLYTCQPYTMFGRLNFQWPHVRHIPWIKVSCGHRDY